MPQFYGILLSNSLPTDNWWLHTYAFKRIILKWPACLLLPGTTVHWIISQRHTIRVTHSDGNCDGKGFAAGSIWPWNTAQQQPEGWQQQAPRLWWQCTLAEAWWKQAWSKFTVRHSVICTVFCCAVNTRYYTVLLQFVNSVHMHCGFKTFTLILKWHITALLTTMQANCVICAHVMRARHRVVFSTSLHSIDSVSDCHGSGSHTFWRFWAVLKGPRSRKPAWHIMSPAHVGSSNHALLYCHVSVGVLIRPKH